MPPAAITPMLSYEDPGAAADWLCRAFGFREEFRLTEDDGRVSHVELRLGDGTVMLGSPPGYVNPLHQREREGGAAWNASPYVIDGVYVRVDDLDAQLERARAAGANVLTGPEEATVPARTASRTSRAIAGCSRRSSRARPSLPAWIPTPPSSGSSAA